jgi:hypothetical protein
MEANMTFRMNDSWAWFLVVSLTCVGCSTPETSPLIESDTGADTTEDLFNIADTGEPSATDTGSTGTQIDFGTPETGIDTGVAMPDASWEDATSDAGDSGCIPKPTGTFVDLEDGTFLDEKTCLMWTKDTVPNPGDQWIGRDHIAACSTIETASYADWRGPDAAEMASLIPNRSGCNTWNDPSMWAPILNADDLVGAPIFWTSTLGDGGEHQCAINGNNGNLQGTSRKNPYHVVCVRGAGVITGSIAVCSGTVCD